MFEDSNTDQTKAWQRDKFKYVHISTYTCITFHKVTDFFQVRRSVRKCFKTVQEEKRINLENKVRTGSEDGLEVCNT